MAHDDTRGDTKTVVRLRAHSSDGGWQRRFVAAPDRVEEAKRLYADMGFEVRIERLEPRQLDPRCGACAETICESHVVIYTRKPAPDSP